MSKSCKPTRVPVVDVDVDAVDDIKSTGSLMATAAAGGGGSGEGGRGGDDSDGGVVLGGGGDGDISCGNSEPDFDRIYDLFALNI